MEDVLGIILFLVILQAIYLGVALFWGTLIYFGWNWLAPLVFHAPHLGFVQSCAGVLLFTMVFKSLHFLTFGFFRKIE